MGKQQYEVGKKWEDQLMDYYNKKGYYTYKFVTGFNGTICDILVSKGGACMFLEAKHTTTDKLRYKSSGLYKKRDELNNFTSKYSNVYIMIKSDKLGIYWTSWLKARPIFEEKGYLDLEKDCYCANKE